MSQYISQALEHLGQASNTQLAAGGAAAAIFIYALYRQHQNRNALPLPPHFPGKPFVGNLLDMPGSFEWETYAKWGKILDSDVIHFKIPGQDVVVLNSYEACIDLLDKRASIYSSRPRMPMVNELIGFDWLFAFMPYGDNWQAHRKLFRQEFHYSFTDRYLPHIMRATHQMLLPRLLDSPQDFLEHFRYTTGAIIMSISYGIEVIPKNDPYIGTAETAFHGLVVASMPGAFLVDSIPILKYVPEWFPGASFKRKARDWGEAAANMINVPYGEVRRKLARNEQRPSFISYCLENMDKTGDLVYQEKAIKQVSAQIYVAGSDTTVSALETLFLGLICFPETQKKAQAELDRVLKGRIPTFEDREKLPYITACVKETFRWNPVTPVCIPHCTITEDVYRGWRIPKNTTILPNAWAILHNEAVYPDPFDFKPERWLDADGKIDKSVPDPWVMFGFGRRTCPGQFVPTSSVWMACASVLALYNVESPLDDTGKPIEINHRKAFTSALTVHTVKYKALFKPRSKESERQIRNIAKAAANHGH